MRNALFAFLKHKAQSISYIDYTFSCLIVIFVAEFFWPNVIPFDFFKFWHLNGSIFDVLAISWLVLMWAFALTLIEAFLTKNRKDFNENAERFFIKGIIISLRAGIFEEISFRWIIFYSQIFICTALNFILFGWAGFGLIEWIYVNILGPIANFFTLGFLVPVLFGSLGWAVGAAVLSSNGKFRNGHIYLGLFGWVNSWFIGMFFFLLMFKYGIIASILVHFLYDFIIFMVRYFDAVIERRSG